MFLNLSGFDIVNIVIMASKKIEEPRDVFLENIECFFGKFLFLDKFIFLFNKFYFAGLRLSLPIRKFSLPFRNKTDHCYFGIT